MAAILFGEAEPLGKYFGRPYEEHLCEIILNFGLQFRRCHLKICICLTLAAILFDGKYLGNDGREPFEEHLCEIILNLDEPFRRWMLYKDLSGDMRFPTMWHFDKLVQPSFKLRNLK